MVAPASPLLVAAWWASTKIDTIGTNEVPVCPVPSRVSWAMETKASA
jgi:hypothetical protein